jgi:ubiquitin C
MHIFVVLHTGNRIIVEVEHSDSVSVLKNEISKLLKLPYHPRLAFIGQELDDNKPLTYYKIQRESVVHMMVKQKGYSIPLNIVIEHTEKTTLMKNTNWEFDINEKGKSFISFHPITDKSMIPFYDEVTQQSYHDGLNQADKKWINLYTGNKYKRLKVQSYTLDPDQEQLEFLKGLYLACWVAVQHNLPFKVYHICNLTEKSFSWLEEGMEFYTPAFLSTSRNENLPWPGNCKWDITLTKGKRHHAVDVKEMSQHPTEDEILISCCTRFRVISKETNHKDFDYYVYLEYLDL